MRTVVEHIAIQIADCIKSGQCLVTGGGALNTFLMQDCGKFSSQFYLGR